MKTPPPPRAELVQQQADEEERRRAAAAVKLAEIDRRIAQRKAEEAAQACEAVILSVVKPEAEPAGHLPADSAEPQLSVPSSQSAEPGGAAVEAAVTRTSAKPSVAEPAVLQPISEPPSPAPNAWIKPLSITGSAAEELHVVLDSATPELNTAATADLAAADAAADKIAVAMAVVVPAGDSAELDAGTTEAIPRSVIGSLGQVEAADVDRGHRIQRGRGRARAECPQEGDTAADRCGNGRYLHDHVHIDVSALIGFIVLLTAILPNEFAIYHLSHESEPM